jgi:hypothetical protein
MKTTIHENIEIEDFPRFYETMRHDHPEILGAEWDKEKRRIKIFYADAATELTDDAIRTLKIPTVLKFRKKIDVPTISNATVTVISENEFMIETFKPETVRKEVKEKLSEFEEVM